MASEVEKILLENPDVDAYVRRTGAELGLFATQTSRGDFQVVLRHAAEDPISLLTKPVRPPLEELEKKLKGLGMKLDNVGKDFTRTQISSPAVDQGHGRDRGQGQGHLCRASVQV